jgi:NTE family protein
MVTRDGSLSTEAAAIKAIVENWEREKKVDLVFQGGGVLGIGLVGAYSELERRGFHAQNLAGTSAGAIVATLIAVGYPAEQIQKIIFDQQFEQFTDPVTPLIGDTWLGRIASVLSRHGVYRGDAFLQRMDELIEDSPVARRVRAASPARHRLTFGDLIYDAQSDRPEHKYKVHVIASDVTGRCMLRLPMDSREKLGIRPEDLGVAEAVRMSMSIPLFFVPVRKLSVGDGTIHDIVDGGMLSNFPVALFDDPPGRLPEWPTLGVKFVEGAASATGDVQGTTPVRSLVEYGRALVETMTSFYDRLHLDADTLARTIGVETGNISGTNFKLSDADKNLLFANGQRAASVFLDQQWTFEGYLATFRLGQDRPHARELITQQMRAAAARIGLNSETEPLKMPEAVIH